MSVRTHIVSLILALPVVACSHQQVFDSKMVEQPKVGQITQSSRLLMTLPSAKEKIAVAVYDFQDQTGQLKPNNNFADYSRAVTQGGLAILNKALLQASNGNWFTVVERGGLKDLLQERQIINLMREQYALPDGSKLGPLPPLLYSGLLIEGGIVGYDSNIVTGGAGAKYLGIGGDLKHQRDIVTVDLRAVNISNGEVVLSVTSEKTIYSTSLQGSIFKYVSFDKIFEAESGFTMNEPPQLAVRQAIETAVYEMIMEGARKGMWSFADPVAGQASMQEYMAHLEKAGALNPSVLPGDSLVGPEEPAPLPARPQAVPAGSVSAPAVDNANGEKSSIIGKVRDLLGDENNAADSGPNYPPVPAPPPPRR